MAPTPFEIGFIWGYLCAVFTYLFVPINLLSTRSTSPVGSYFEAPIATSPPDSDNDSQTSAERRNQLEHNRDTDSSPEPIPIPPPRVLSPIESESSTRAPTPVETPLFIEVEDEDLESDDDDFPIHIAISPYVRQLAAEYSDPIEELEEAFFAHLRLVWHSTGVEATELIEWACDHSQEYFERWATYRHLIIPQHRILATDPSEFIRNVAQRQLDNPLIAVHHWQQRAFGTRITSRTIARSRYENNRQQAASALNEHVVDSYLRANHPDSDGPDGQHIDNYETS